MSLAGVNPPLADAVLLDPTDFLDLIKLEHVLAGIYIWEYFTTLDVEWRFYHSKKKKGATSTAWIYSLCKLSALGYTIVNLIGLNVTSGTAISCEGWIISRFTFATLSIMCASALAVIRISAVWDRNLFAVIPAVATSLAFAAFWLRQAVLSHTRATFVPELGCEYIATTNERPLAIAILGASTIFLALLTGGLLKRGVFGRADWWRAFYLQGVAWLLLATFFSIPGVVLLYKNLNGAWNQMLRGPEFLILVIGATRLYSTLMNRGSFATYRDDITAASNQSKPAQLEAFKVRSPGSNGNTVTFELTAGALHSSATGENEDTQDSATAAAVKSTQLGEGSIKDEEAGRESEILYIGNEKVAQQERF